METKQRNVQMTIGTDWLSPILATKLYIPDTPVKLISRIRLLEKMNQTLSAKLTIVTAPAGFGKTTLVSDWIAQSDLTAVWVSLGKEENDAVLFWNYVITALQGMKPGIGQQMLTLLQSTMQPKLEEVLPLLINELVHLQAPCILFLDDYHLIEAEEVHRSLTFFLERLPVHMHLCIISRTEVPLPLGKLRVKEQLNEIDAMDLRFTSEEISSYWNRQKSVFLTPDELQLLEERTEGWIAGLQLVALSSREQLSPFHAIKSFSGSHRYVVDYLMEEVFQNLPDDVQLFLLQTSILDRMNSSLCAAVTKVEKGEKFLEELEYAGLLLIPLNEGRLWYRYHHLFADFLRDRVKQLLPDQIPLLHRRASDWFKQNHYLTEAIDHAILAEDFEWAAELIISDATVFFKRRELTTLERWISQLPEHVEHMPDMMVIKGWTQLLLGNMAASNRCVKYLHQSIPSLYQSAPPGQIARIVEEVMLLEHFTALFRRDSETVNKSTAAVLNREDVHETLVQMDREPLLLAGIELNEGLPSVFRGFVGFFGKLKQAEVHNTLFFQLLEKYHLLQKYHFAANNYTALSEIHYEKNELEQAMKLGLMASELAYEQGNIGAFVPTSLTIARIHWASGDCNGAFKAIDHAMQALNQLGELHLHWVSIFEAFLARCYIMLADDRRVDDWLSTHRGNAEVSMYQDFENLTLLRAMIFKKEYHEALCYSQRLRTYAETEDWTGSLLEIGLLQAVILYELNDIDKAVRMLHQTMLLAEKEGYVRTILDERLLLHKLIGKYVELRKNRHIPELQSGVSSRFVERLITAIGEDEAKMVQTDGSVSELVTESLSPLTKREMEVLTLLGQGLSNKEIAAQLVLSDGTVRIHLHRIYSKLECSNRIQAIQKAKRLHILS
ncbi:MAG: LuxR C-terminal-related transcriptional regulator [Clostridia bacterium]